MILPVGPGRADDVFVGVASIPERVGSLETVVAQLLPQAARIGVYLNGYRDVPDFLRHERVDVARSQDHGDVRDNGKFFFLESTTCRYYATVDDDISYPADYLARLVATLSDAGPGSAVGVHGASYPQPVLHAFDSRVLLHFEHRVPHVMPVHLLGTGTTVFDQREWMLRYEEFGTPGMADIWFARAACERGFSMFTAARKRRWLQAIRVEDGGALFHEGLRRSTEQLTALRSMLESRNGFDALVQSIASRPTLIGRLGVHHALRLDRVRRQLGLAPLSTEAAGHIGEVLREQRSTWQCDEYLTGDERQALHDVVMAVLEERPLGYRSIEAVDALDRLSALRSIVPAEWDLLPESLQVDTSSPQLEESTASLLHLAVHDERVPVGDVWSRVEQSRSASVDLTIAAASRGATAPLELVTELTDRAGREPLSAAEPLRRYLEATNWRLPDVNALRRAFGTAFSEPEVTLPLSVAAHRSGETRLAGRLLAESGARRPWDPDVRLMQASLEAARNEPADRLRNVFRVLDESVEAQRLTPYRSLIDAGTAHGTWIDSMHADPDAAERLGESGPAVSVIMTTHNDAATIVPAMRSILASAAIDVELIVVDDCSTDDTAAHVESIADTRVVYIRNAANVGPYVSRNVALERASGEYVAIADGDDWSHPDRLRYQVSFLETHPSVSGCKVGHVRLLPDGEPDLENHGRFLGDGPMTLMYRRGLVDHIGGFDHVRTRGDMEFMRRLVARFGAAALVTLGTPLVLAMSTPSSNSKRFSDEDLAAYRVAARTWHRSRAGSNELFVPLRGRRAPFIAPHRLRVDDVGGGWTS